MSGLPSYGVTPTDTRRSSSCREDGMTHREHSAVVLNLALAIADETARADVESYAFCEVFEEGRPSIYRLGKSQAEGGQLKRTPESDAYDIAMADRAARYIELRQPHLPYVMHRHPEDRALVWFTLKEGG